jgi:glycosyltransferase involved in cell wall biosynthesis
MAIYMEWPNDKCEPVIISYNRVHHLVKTLDAFASLKSTSMRMHVLDNASTDTTRQTVEKYQKEWPGLCYRRNPYNIGGNGNIVRSVEISDSEYHWVIGDDDEWHLDNFGELIGILKEGKADIIRLGWMVGETSRGKYMDALALANSESRFFAGLSMISSVILRRTLVATYLPQAYMNIGELFPQIVPVVKAIEEKDLVVYSLKTDVMRHTPSTEPGYLVADTEIFAGWFKSSRFLKSPALRARFIDGMLQFKFPEFSMVKAMGQYFKFIKSILFCRAFNADQSGNMLVMYSFAKKWRVPIALAILINALAPVRVMRYLWKNFSIRNSNKEHVKRFEQTVAERERRL